MRCGINALRTLSTLALLAVPLSQLGCASGSGRPGETVGSEVGAQVGGEVGEQGGVLGELAGEAVGGAAGGAAGESADNAGRQNSRHGK